MRERSNMPTFELLREQLALPVVCAPMFLVSGIELVVAASENGIIGSFPTMNARTVEDLDRWFDEITSRLAKARARGVAVAPFAANVVTHSSNKRLQEDVALIVKYRAPIVITALGSPRAVVDAVHGYGGLVFADVITPAFARKAIEAGVDGLVLVCSGAGGHFGPLAAPAFTAEVREFWNGPLILAGAVADARGVRAYQALGADLVYMGTRFIATPESLAHPDYKRMVVEANSADIVPTKAITGAWANFMRQSMEACGFDPTTAKPKARVDASDPLSEAETRPWKNIWSAGQIAGQVRAIEPVADIVSRLKREYAEAVKREAADPWVRKYLDA